MLAVLVRQGLALLAGKRLALDLQIVVAGYVPVRRRSVFGLVLSPFGSSYGRLLWFGETDPATFILRA